MASGRPENGSRVRVWNYEFEWTLDHRTSEELRPMMFTYDELATRCLDRLDDLQATDTPIPGGSGPKSLASKKGHPDLYELLRRHASADDTLGALWDQVTTVPDWVDWAEVERGQRVFYRYAGPCIVGLTFQSLLGGMGSARVVETLTRTGGFGVRVARRRLLATFQHVLDVTDSPASLRAPAGAGFASSLRVRLLHARVRRRILALAGRDPSYFPAADLGVPINDLDSAGTVLSFSASLVWIALPRQGIFLRAGEAAALLALWRYVAHLLGAPTAPLASPRAARAWMESLLLAELRRPPSATSRVLARNLVAALAHQPPARASAEFLCAEARWLNGDALTRALGLSGSGFWDDQDDCATAATTTTPNNQHRNTNSATHVVTHRQRLHSYCRRHYYALLVAGQCLFFMTLCYARRSVRAWDEAGIARARTLLRRLTLEQLGGEEAAHGFEHVPEAGKLTTAEGPVVPAPAAADSGNDDDEGRGKGGGGRGGGGGKAKNTARAPGRPRIAVVSGGVETRNLGAVLLASLVAGWVAWLGVKCASGLLQMLG